jgi:two-component system cell cycle response regulator DivK
LVELPPRLYEAFGFRANRFGHGKKVGLVRFEEAQQRGQQRGVGCPNPQFVSPDSGQINEPLRPPVVTKRCRKCGEGKCHWIIVVCALHSVRLVQPVREGILARILIVEDNALNIKLFCDLLAAHGHQPEAVTDSRVALDAARQFDPDLVITDIQLPHVSGLDLIRMIRGDKQLAEVPIMAVTAYSARGDEERIRAAGAQAYVSKPISVVRFAETVDELLKNGHDKVGDAAEIDNPESRANESDDSPGPGEAGGEEI